MIVDKSRGDYLPLGVYCLLAFLRVDILLQGGDFLSVDGDIHGAIYILCRVDYPAAFYNQVIHVGPPFI